MSKQKEKSLDLSPQELRKANYDAMKKTSKVQREQDIREDFKRYFVKLKRKLNLDAQLEDIIWLHLKSTGCANKDKFDEGVKHFGYKI